MKIVLSYVLKWEMGHPVLPLTETQWKLGLHGQNFPMEGKPL